jgi:hypothetical protein
MSDAQTGDRVGYRILQRVLRNCYCVGVMMPCFTVLCSALLLNNTRSSLFPGDGLCRTIYAEMGERQERYLSANCSSREDYETILI